MYDGTIFLPRGETPRLFRTWGPLRPSVKLLFVAEGTQVDLGGGMIWTARAPLILVDDAIPGPTIADTVREMAREDLRRDLLRSVLRPVSIIRSTTP